MTRSEPVSPQMQCPERLARHETLGCRRADIGGQPAEARIHHPCEHGSLWTWIFVYMDLCGHGSLRAWILWAWISMELGSEHGFRLAFPTQGRQEPSNDTQSEVLQGEGPRSQGPRTHGLTEMGS